MKTKVHLFHKTLVCLQLSVNDSPPAQLLFFQQQCKQLVAVWGEQGAPAIPKLEAGTRRTAQKNSSLWYLMCWFCVFSLLTHFRKQASRQLGQCFLQHLMPRRQTWRLPGCWSLNHWRSEGKSPLAENSQLGSVQMPQQTKVVPQTSPSLSNFSPATTLGESVSLRMYDCLGT